MTDESIFDKVKPQNKQVGGSHYRKMVIQPYEFISKNNLSFFQGNVVKYVCRYLNKNKHSMSNLLIAKNVQIHRIEDNKHLNINR